MRAKLKVFTNIGELLTLEGARSKQARHPQQSDLGVIKSAALVCRDGKVEWVGHECDLKTKASDAEFISLEGRTVIPAFVEPHTHLIFAGDRSHEFEWRIQGQTYQQIAAKGGGIRHTVNETRKASVAELTRLAEERAEVFVRQGVTTLEVKSGYGLDVETELRCLQVARALKGPRVVTTYLGAHSRSPEFPDLDSYLHMLCNEMLPRVAREKLADRVDIYVEEGFFSVEQGRTYFRRAQELGLGITAHVDQLSDTDSTAMTLEFAPQSVDHVVFASDASIRKLAASGATAVLLPSSDFYLRMQYPKARAMIEAGVRVALSTDFNPGTSPTQDLSLVGVLARLEMRMTLPEVLVAYTLGAAFALAREAHVGSLSVDKYCDFSVLSGSWSELFYSVGRHPIQAVYKSGEPLLRS